MKDTDEIRDLLEEVEALTEEIDDIKTQLRCGLGDSSWKHRASTAMYHRIRDRTKAVRRLAELGHTMPQADATKTSAAIRVQEMKLEAQRINAENAQRMAEAKAERIAASSTRERRRLKALTEWLQDNHPHMMQDVYAVMDAAE